MNTEMIGVVVTFLVTVVLAYPLGRYIAKVFKGERTWLDFLSPVERGIFRICGIDPTHKMNWKEFLKAMLTINLLWFVICFCPLYLPGEAADEPGREPKYDARPWV